MDAKTGRKQIFKKKVTFYDKSSMNHTNNSSISIQNSEFKNTKILFLHVDESQCDSYETRIDLDPDFQRLNVFFSSDLNHARDLSKRITMDLVVIPENMGPFDYVSLQTEFLNLNPKVKIIPLIEVPQIEKIRQSKIAGGVVEYGDPKCLSDYENLKNFLFYVLRTHLTLRFHTESDLRQIKPIQMALGISSKITSEQKQITPRICAEIIQHFDLNEKEIHETLLAESLYFPDLDPSTVQTVLKGTDYESLSTLLLECSSWSTPRKNPQSPQGFAITLANYIVDTAWKEHDPQSLLKAFQNRVPFLCHPSITLFKNEDIIQLFQIVQSEKEVFSCAS